MRSCGLPCKTRIFCKPPPAKFLYCFLVWNHMGRRVAPSISIHRELSYSCSIDGEAQSRAALFVIITK
jgi:hypothetical protein